MTDLSLASLEAMVKDMLLKDAPITLKPTKLIIPGPVRQWLDERGYTHEDVLDMVKEAHAAYMQAKEAEK
jgi:predicted TIM-barrel enzyme